MSSTNQQNAQHSTGPRTTEGKAIAAQNARKHGLSVQRHILLPGEDPAAYQRLLDELIEMYQPQSAREQTAIEDFAHCRWAIQRADAIELRLLAEATEEDPFPAGLDRILRYRGSWERRAQQALRERREAVLERQREQRIEQTEPLHQARLTCLQVKAQLSAIELKNRQHTQAETEYYREQYRQLGLPRQSGFVSSQTKPQLRKE